MKARISLSVEIIDGPDKGYTFEENNRIVELSRETYEGEIEFVRPYLVKVAFMTPDLYREIMERFGRN